MELNVNIVPQSYLPEIRVSKNDNTMRTIKVNLIDEKCDPWTPPAGASAVFTGTKPSGLGFTLPCTISGSAVTFTMLTTACNEVGRFPAEVRFTDGSGGRIGSCNVMMNVERDPHSDDTTDGDEEELINEITALLEEIREEHQQAIEDITEAKTDALQDIGAAKDDALDAIAADVQAADAAAQRAQESADQAAESEAKAEQAKQEWENMSATAETLPAGSDATASYSEGVLSLGIPTGPQGAQGPQGDPGQTGATPDLQIGTVETLDPGEDATATITGTPEEPILSLGIPQGEKGDPGDVSMEQLLALAVYDEASGEIASFQDGSDGFPMKSLKVSLEPIQEATPWIGTEENTAPYTFRSMPEQSNDYNRESLNQIVGATVGWNQLKSISGLPATQTINGVTFTNNGDGSITANGTATGGDAVLDCSISWGSNGVYYMHGCPQGGSDSTYYMGNAYYKDTGNGYMLKDNTAPSGHGFRIYIKDGYTANSLKFYPQFNWLTGIFGTSIADKAYTLEQSTAGSGIAWLKSYGFLTKDYYEYAQPRLESVRVSGHETVGFNQWDEEWEVGRYNYSNGVKQASSDNIRNKNIIPVIPNATYYISNSGKGTATVGFYVFLWYDKDGNYLSYSGSQISKNGFVPVPENAYYLNFYVSTLYGTTYTNDICINISKTTGSPKNGDYVPHEKHSYTLDSSLTLRGILKLSGDEIYADGDVYPPSGGVSREYSDVLDLSTLDWTYNTNWNAWYTGYYQDIKGVSDGAYLPNFVSDKYLPLEPNYALSSSYTGTGISCTIRSSSGCRILVKNGSSTTQPSGHLVYEKQTPTTEQADPYTQIQICDPDGTEAFTDYGVASGDRDVAIPVGHESTYSLVCPIYGHDEVTVEMRGKNLWHTDFTNSGGGLTKRDGEMNVNVSAQTNTTYLLGGSSAYIGYVLEAGTYTLSVYSDDFTGIYVTLSDGTTWADGATKTFATEITINNVRCWEKVLAVGTYTLHWQLQIERGSTATDYEPYTSRTITTTLPQTVYGGTLDVVTGELVVDRAMVDLGTLTWTTPYTGTNHKTIRTDVPSSYKGYPSTVAYFLSEKYQVAGYTNAIANMSAPDSKDIGIYWYRNPTFPTPTSLYIVCDVNDSASGKLVYELATPITTQLTPTEVDTILGTNNVWSDGDVYVKYVADTKLYILKVISQ